MQRRQKASVCGELEFSRMRGSLVNILGMISFLEYKYLKDTHVKKGVTTFRRGILLLKFCMKSCFFTILDLKLFYLYSTWSILGPVMEVPEPMEEEAEIDGTILLDFLRISVNL